MKWKFQLGSFKPWGNFSSVFQLLDEIFVYNRNSLFKFLSLNIWEEISSRFNELKFQPGLKLPTIKSDPKMQLFPKINNHLLFDWVLNALVLCAWYLSLRKFSCTTLFVTFSCLRWFKAMPFIIFHETHIPALQLTAKSYRKDWWHFPICSYIIQEHFL